MLTKPGLLLRVEGACILALSIVCYREIRASWILYLVLFLVPDLAMFGYLRGVPIGTISYNLVHTLIGPLLLTAYAIPAQSTWLSTFALIWASHIGFDRMLGFGLKYPTRFNDTHLQRVVGQ
jgi:Domain of unknown function (DUF4260)